MRKVSELGLVASGASTFIIIIIIIIIIRCLDMSQASLGSDCPR